MQFGATELSQGTNQDNCVAYHEAGHLIAAHRLGLPFSGKQAISIIEAEDYRGVFIHKNILQPDEVYTNPDRARLKMERLVVSKLAGIEAQRSFDPNSVDCGDGLPGGHWDGVSDYHDAIGLIDHFVGSNEELEAYLNLLRIRARNLVASNWPYIEAIAERLLEKKTLSAADARQVISAVIQASVERAQSLASAT